MTARTGRDVSRPGLAGVRDVLPLTIGVMPLAAAIGGAVSGSDAVPAWGGWLAGPLLFASSGLLAGLSLLDAGAGPVPVVAAVLVVNARLAVYALELAPRFDDQPGWFRWIGPHFLVDQTYLLATVGPSDALRFRRYWLGAGLVMWAAWSATLVASVLLGAGGLDLTSLGFAPVAVFVGLLVPLLRRRAAGRAAAIAGSVALAGAALPLGLGLLAGVALGVLPSGLATARPPEAGRRRFRITGEGAR